MPQMLSKQAYIVIGKIKIFEDSQYADIRYQATDKSRFPSLAHGILN